MQYFGGIQAPATELYADLTGRRVGFRAHQLEVANGKAGRHAFQATVTVTGNHRLGELRASLPATDPTGWRCCTAFLEFEPGYVLDAVLDPDNVFVFDAADRLVAAP